MSSLRRRKCLQENKCEQAMLEDVAECQQYSNNPITTAKVESTIESGTESSVTKSGVDVTTEPLSVIDTEGKVYHIRLTG